MFVLNHEAKLEDVGGGVTRKILAHDGIMMQVEVNFEDGAIGYMHAHPHEQVTYVVSGEFSFTVGDVTKIVKAGDSVYMEPNVMHGCECIKKGVLIDNFTPQREDFLAPKA